MVEKVDHKMENTKEFQITQSWGNGCKAWEYFEIDSGASLIEIEAKAINCIKEIWRKQKEYPSFSVPEKCKKKIKISEYKDGDKVKGGIRITTKWR